MLLLLLRRRRRRRRRRRLCLRLRRRLLLPLHLLLLLLLLLHILHVVVHVLSIFHLKAGEYSWQSKLLCLLPRFCKLCQNSLSLDVHGVCFDLTLHGSELKRFATKPGKLVLAPHRYFEFRMHGPKNRNPKNRSYKSLCRAAFGCFGEVAPRTPSLHGQYCFLSCRGLGIHWFRAEGCFLDRPLFRFVGFRTLGFTGLGAFHCCYGRAHAL